MRHKRARSKVIVWAAAVCCSAAMAASGWAVDVGQQPSAFESRQVDAVPNPGEWAGEHALARSSNGTLYAVYGGKSLFMATKGPSDTDWSVQVVDSSYRVGKHNSLALDSSGYPHISYATFSENIALKYARWDGSSWQIEYVDGESIENYAGCNNAIAIDSNNRPHIAYAGRKVSPNGYEVRNLKYAYHDGTTWQTATVDADADINPDASYSPLSIAVDSTNTPHISYYDYRHVNVTDDGYDYFEDVRYATRNGTAWSTEKVDDAGWYGIFNSIAVDSTNTPHISYQSGNILMHAKSDGAGGWDTTVVYGATENGNSIAIGPNDRPQIGYFDYSLNEVMLAKFNGTTWDTETVFAPAYSQQANIDVYTVSIIVDNSNQAYFLFNETYWGKKVYSSTWDGSAWQTQLVDLGGNLAHRNDIVTDKKGFSHVSYRRSGQQRFDDTGYRIEFSDLMYARWDGKEWVTQAIDQFDPSTVPADHRNGNYNRIAGIHNAIALDAQGTPHFSYFERNWYWDTGLATTVYNYSLKYATWDGTAWVTETLVSSTSSDYYPFSSIGVDAQGNVHISYFDETNEVLMYIKKDGTGWQAPVQVDDCDGNECGSWSDLALDAMGNPHISYHDYDDGELMYAYWDGTAWQKTVVDDCGGTEYCGKSTSIAIDRNNKPHISYRDGGWNDGSAQAAPQPCAMPTSAVRPGRKPKSIPVLAGVTPAWRLTGQVHRTSLTGKVFIKRPSMQRPLLSTVTLTGQKSLLRTEEQCGPMRIVIGMNKVPRSAKETPLPLIIWDGSRSLTAIRQRTA